STAWACCRLRQRTCGKRAAGTGDRRSGIGNTSLPRSTKRRSPGRGSKELLVVIQGQSVQWRRIGIEPQHPNVGECSQVKYLHEGLRHALGPVFLPQLLGGDALDMLQIRIRPGGGDQLHADRGAVRDAEGDEQKSARLGDVRQFGEKAARLDGEMGTADLPAPAVEARLEAQ